MNEWLVLFIVPCSHCIIIVTPLLHYTGRHGTHLGILWRQTGQEKLSTLLLLLLFVVLERALEARRSHKQT